MPLYGFYCDRCENKFDRFLSIDDRDKPLHEVCEKCGENSIKRDYTGFKQAVSVDANVTPDKKTGGQWSELMKKMKKGLSPIYHENLDRATNQSGTRWN